MTESELSEKLPLLAKPRLSSHLIETESGLQELLLALQQDKTPIALDAERASGFRYGQRAYLIQIAIENSGIFLFDPVGEYQAESLEQLRKLINATTWIIHAATQDIPCLVLEGFRPSKILDTELAGRLLGLPRVSLSTLTEHFLGYTLAKEHSAVDWSTRPLPTDWLNYAALDVDVLFELWNAVESELESKNKLAIALAEFAHLTVITEKPEKQERWRSVTGIHELKDQRQLTIVKSMWEARETLAKDKDIAPGRLIPDASIVAAVKANPKSRSELNELRSFTGRASRTYIDIWWEAYVAGNTTNHLVDVRPKHVGMPNHRNWPTKFPEAHARLTWSKKLLSEIAVAVSIPLENLLSPETVKSICFEPPVLDLEEVQNYLRLRQSRKWQVDLVAPILLEALSKSELPPTQPLTASDPE